MSLIAKLTCIPLLTALAALGSTISFIGPTTPTGTPCSVADPQCVIGGLPYAIFGAQLTQPTGSSNLWALTIETNYPTLISGNIIPPAQWGVDLLDYSIGDFMIHWNGNDYALVLAQHIKASNPVDNYAAGNLYQAPNVSPDFVPSGTNTTLFGTAGILPGSSRPNAPVWLAAGGTLIGNGTITVANNGSGTPAQYTITDTFTAFPGFLSTGDFSVSIASQSCANGMIVGGGGNFVGGSSVPEPSTIYLFPAALELVLLARISWVRKASK